MFFSSSIEEIIVVSLVILLAITIHEFAHAYVADYLGDPTPRLMGRVTLNPLVHLDPLGILFFVVVGFGWGKPVLFDPFNLKNPRRDAGFIALAGPISNIILAAFASIILRIVLFYKIIIPDFWIIFLISLIKYNLILAIFNLVPVYPLDGFNIVEAFLPEEKAREWSELRKYGMIFLFLLVIPIFGDSLIFKIIETPLNFLLDLFFP